MIDPDMRGHLELAQKQRAYVALFSARGAFDDDVIAARDAGRVLCFTGADLT